MWSRLWPCRERGWRSTCGGKPRPRRWPRFPSTPREAAPLRGANPEGACSMLTPADLKYTEEHEWVKLEGKEALVGITDYAQTELGDIVFVELPAVGAQVKQGDIFGTIEAVKTVS